MQEKWRKNQILSVAEKIELNLSYSAPFNNSGYKKGRICNAFYGGNCQLFVIFAVDYVQNENYFCVYGSTTAAVGLWWWQGK